MKCPVCKGRGFETGPYMGENIKSHWDCMLCKGKGEISPEESGVAVRDPVIEEWRRRDEELSDD